MLKVLAPITELQQGLASSSSIAGRFPTLPIMSNVLLQASGGRLNLTATDFEITFKSSYDAEVLEEGSISVPAKTLFDIANSLSGSAVRLEERESLVL